MDLLQASAVAFQKLTGSDYVITARKREHTIRVSVFFETGHFFHLIGLSKLRDIPVLNNKNKGNVFQRILNGEITYDTISKSAFFEAIRDRIYYFSELETLLNNEIILKFNQNKAHSLIHATMLLYRKQDDVYLHLFLTPKDSQNDILIPCSFFPRNDNKYILHQEVYKVIQIERIQHPEIQRPLFDRIITQARRQADEQTDKSHVKHPSREER
ncbi:phage-Barnase-EndoU-ColicinE5/D-RelE like nuclease4 [Caprobacter fermentans]|uniref:Phage-Barnase-EndoU-ColicinE5/D-RelE like nuclease4 n=1 Tax=Caproicibacter fermentans TaxID=2576756 RepID=A0A6N8HWM7_9FIRM|nr:PBECR4 domain-containing protein [Caproicibacter fermentans]MVB10142.1 phage-Barnase-EndoU-ColicinE5/D-RelE like nuclease4 [Caproicibacter fermentans]